MRYFLANYEKAASLGFNPHTHKNNGNLMLLNEREVMACRGLEGTAEERATSLEATLYTTNQAKVKLSKLGML